MAFCTIPAILFFGYFTACALLPSRCCPEPRTSYVKHKGLQGREWQDYDSDQQALDIDPLLTQPEQVRGRVQQFQDLELRKNTALNLEAETEEVNFKQPEGSVLLNYLKFLTSGAWDDLQKFIEETNQYKYTETH